MANSQPSRRFLYPNGTILLASTIVDDRAASLQQGDVARGRGLDITEHNLLYASVETGFKIRRAFSSRATMTSTTRDHHRYTLGSKNRFLENRLQANFELYYWNTITSKSAI